MSTTVVAWGHGVNFADPLTTTVNVGSDADRVAFVAVGRANNSTPEPVSVTVGSDSLTAQGSLFTDVNGWKWRLYAGALTVTGSQTVTADYNSNLGFAIMVGLVESGVDTGAVIEGLQTGSAATGTSQPTWTVTSASGDKVAALFSIDSSTTFTPGSGTTSVAGTSLGGSGSGTLWALTESGAASVVIGGTLGATNIWRGFAFNIPNAGGGDVTPPNLTSPTGTGGTLTCSGSVSTDEGNGSLYAVVTGSATAPTAAQVKLGQDHTGSAALRAVGPQSVSATGVQSIGSGSCTAGTRYFHYMHEDAAANQSAVVSSSSFTVSAATPTTATLSGPSSGTTGSASTNFTVTLDVAADTTYTITPAGTNGTVTFTPSSPSITTGQTSVTFTANAALDGLHDISITTSPSLTIAGSPVAYTTSSLSGFDFHTDPYIFGDLAGGLTGLTRETSIGITVAVYAIDTTTVPGAKIPGSKLWQSGILTTDSNGKLTRQTNAAFTAGTEYMLLFVRQSDGQTCAVTAAAT